MNAMGGTCSSQRQNHSSLGPQGLVAPPTSFNHPVRFDLVPKRICLFVLYKYLMYSLVIFLQVQGDGSSSSSGSDSSSKVRRYSRHSVVVAVCSIEELMVLK
jgi:hypothetical protein